MDTVDIKRIEKIGRAAFRSQFKEFAARQLKGVATLKEEGGELWAEALKGADAAFARTLRFLVGENLIQMREPALQAFLARRR